MSGGSSHNSQLCICPDLKSWAATEMQKEGAVLKERRKAREERADPKKGAEERGCDGWSPLRSPLLIVPLT